MVSLVGKVPRVGTCDLGFELRRNHNYSCGSLCTPTSLVVKSARGRTHNLRLELRQHHDHPRVSVRSTNMKELVTEEVKVIGVWSSVFSKRVEIALKMKGIEYEFVEEDLRNKSEELLKYNPVHKKIPVLVHNGEPIVESLIILEYIDETWKDNPILPEDVHDRALARFWASFIDTKVWPAMVKTRVSRGEDSSLKAMEKLHSLLTILEDEIQGKNFFGGNEIGFVDIVALFLAYWLPLIREAIGKDQVITIDKFPGLCNWSHNLLKCSVIQDNVPNKERLLNFFRAAFAGATRA